ncbi:PREDICTED: uncharacterized protein LOC109129482 [Camelina sativa]|uniref:Uncharacterized protein LOC109129482 n=1 Tax=Camelina sativa TaxID=90675 RepID=A0ABM1R2Q3_CAMSA|nr:PREDICTED: uncharacterized protein LOC109129482 [Camelina sativa]
MNLISQLADLQDETMKMLHEKLDKIESDLSGKRDDIAVRVRSIEEQRYKDTEAMEKKLHFLEEEQERHLKSAQDNAINIKDLANEVSDLTKDHESKCGVLFNKDLDTRKRVENLENREYEAERKMFGLDFEQKRFGELISKEFTFTKESHKLLKEIEAEQKEKDQDLAAKIEDLTSYALCDFGSCINIMSTDAVKKIGLRHLQLSDIRIGLANSLFTIAEGMVRDIHVRVGICNVPTDFQIINAEKGSFTPLILGGAFLAKAGAVMDWHNRRMTLTNISGDIFYEAKPFNPPTRRCREEDYARDPPDAYIGERSKRACLRITDSSHPA